MQRRNIVFINNEFKEEVEMVAEKVKAAKKHRKSQNSAGINTNRDVLYGYSLPVPNQLKHKTLSNGLIDVIVGIS